MPSHRDAWHDGAAPGSAIRRVLLATDLGPTSALATAWAFDLAMRNDAALLVVSVIDPRELALPGGGFTARVDQVRERRESAAQTLVERGRRAGTAVTFLVWTGDPGEAIVEAADAEDADIILVGAHTRGPIARWLIGSVSEYVSRHASCPVLIVRAVSDARPRPGRPDSGAPARARSPQVATTSGRSTFRGRSDGPCRAALRPSTMSPPGNVGGS